MSDYTISAANLNYIENSLNTINGNLNVINDNVNHGNQVIEANVQIVQDEVAKLAAEFHEFVNIQMRANAKSNSQQRLIQIRQEIEKKFGHYDQVRRTTTGILQADDLGIIKKETISTATEELMLSTPGYWLAPCLVALAAWINDQPELAEKAVREGIKRDDEKTSLFFTLVCRRAERKSAALKWTQRYLANQNEEELDRNTVIILDAFASGLLGADSEGVISKQMGDWLERLAAKPGFIEEQTKQWSTAINAKRQPLDESEFTYLPKYSKTWPQLQNVLEGAYLHAELLAYFMNIFNQEASTAALKVQLDEILTSLVTNFDDEEVPFKKEEKYHELVVYYEGDEARARAHMDEEKTAFEERRDFTQLLTDAAMKPESSGASVSTQKFAIALSKEWIMNAYNDVVAKNRMEVPHEIEINVDTFNDKTTDGTNEIEMLGRFNKLIDSERDAILATLKLTGFQQYMNFAGIAIAVIGLLMLFSNFLLGLIAIIAGVALFLKHKNTVKELEEKRQRTINEFEEKRTKGTEIIRATLAEVVDFRALFEKKDAESTQVVDFLEQISPEQYVRKLADSGRKVKL